MRPLFFPVIMCGGSGTRLWPLSRRSRPKQFIPLVDGQSTFRQTVRRLAKLDGWPSILVVAGLAHLDWILSDAAEAGVAVEVLLEPEARDSAAAIAAAAAWIVRHDPNGVAVVVASDHHIPDDGAFLAAVEAAGSAAEAGRIVTLGVSPSYASTAYGYIRAGKALPAYGPAREVAAFVEKPGADLAEDYVSQGYLWNSGNFIARAEVLLSDLDRFAPLVSAAARRAVDDAAPHRGALRLGPQFVEAPKTSLDYAVMERTERAVVIPVSFDWSDLGAWDAVWRASPRDGMDNSSHGRIWADEARSCLVRTPPSLQVALIGVSDLAVVCDGASLLVCNMAASQRVKQAADALNSETALHHPEEPVSLADWSARLHHWLKTAALPLWWAIGADHARGGYHERLTLDGEALAEPRRARVQARQVFTYALAAHLGFAGPWLSAADHGFAFFADRYRRGDGLFRTLVSPAGESVDDTAFLYDQAFALIAMAALFQAEPGRKHLPSEARSLLQAVDRAFGLAGGAYRESGRHPFQANALMHLFEAALAWRDLDCDPVWAQLASRLASHATGKLYDPRARVIAEFYDETWRHADGDDGDVVEPGHQFEWAWLLHRWSLIDRSPLAADVAKALFASGLRGYDARRSVVVDELDARGNVRRASARLWPQTEFLKAALCLAVADGESETASFRSHATNAARGLWRYLEAPTLGLWRDKLGSDDVFEPEPAPASSFYHIIGAISALRNCKEGRRDGSPEA